MTLFSVNDKFKISENFLMNYKGKNPNWGPLGYITYKRTYARDLGDRTEEYWETVKRVVEGCYTIQLNHCKSLKLPWNAYKAQKSAQEMFKLMWDFKFLPPGRGLWAMGSNVVYERGSAALNNCAFVSTSQIDTVFSEPFCFLMDMSLVGVGVAFDTLGANKVDIKKPKVGEYTFVVPDTREGWVELVRIYLDSYIGHNVLPKDIDYSVIRPEGSIIKTFGGIAPGPGPLIKCVEELTLVLNSKVGQKLTSTDIVDIMNILGKAVVSGGIRRVAELALGVSTDEDYLKMKDPKLYSKELTDWRWASNNTISCNTGMNYNELANQTIMNGEPGYFWLENAQKYGRLKDGENWVDRYAGGTNPCGEQTLESFEICNLVETFPSRHKTPEEYMNTLKYAYLYAKTVTLVPTHNERTNSIMLRNRRIGLSQSGIVEAFEKFGTRNFLENWCDRGYKYIKELDQEYSGWLCIPESIKRTTVKPSGTVSLLPGVTPGIHYGHSKYYYRLIELNKTSPLVKVVKDAGYRVEDSIYKENSYVVYFGVNENFERYKEDISIWEQIENAANMQYYWSDNQVSVTVTFNKDEAKDLSKVLELYESRIKAVSFLPVSDHKYKQAVYQDITKEEYDNYIVNLKPLDFSGITNTADQLEKFCSNDSCMLK